MSDLLERLRAIGCDREPFTPAHKDCICRLTNEAANEIELLKLFARIAISKGRFLTPLRTRPNTANIRLKT